MHTSRLLALFCFTLIATGCGTGPANSSKSGPAGSPGLVFIGPYSAQTLYVVPDVVTYQGSSYVALVGSTGVLPIGAPTSTSSWAVLAQAGSNGPIGATGATGPQGPQGVMGSQGNNGPKGDPGSQGPTGPAGPEGATGPAGLSGVSHLAGKNWGVQGDSISSIFHNAWQNVVNTRTGMNQKYQEARPGRKFSTAFECYGNPPVGGTLGTFNSAFVFPVVGGTCAGYEGGVVDGNTLAQNLAGIDLLVIDLGTNDTSTALGQLGDSTTAGTFYGNMRWVVETYLTAKPSLRIVMVTLQYTNLSYPAKVQEYANATAQYGNSMGIPVINMFANGGVNEITSTTLTIDGTHPSQVGFTNFYGPVIAQGIEQVY